jgi:cytochrome c-type biogenesis protein CcmH
MDPVALVGPPAGEPLAGAALEARTQEVASLLRCPVCQGLSVEDSPATQEQILSYFEGSYGEFVRLDPPLRGVNWLVWLAPLGALVLGGVVVSWMLRTRAAAPATRDEAKPLDLPARNRLPDDPELVPYVLRVRELAYGWPGGKPPGEDA